ncbi:hypothetical protein K488DRAFT_82003 [Vararia minispora EC-137]|uniref:Uncharacterized protein n=1 Tax=Vararia minispora EC-137 TaxID=1314806 RepID=A0ACB8QYA3_9AGAM|nr:hypothetical protein K488DRAFT_82003 [Vararia minispora EC-137]
MRLRERDGKMQTQQLFCPWSLSSLIIIFSPPHLPRPALPPSPPLSLSQPPRNGLRSRGPYYEFLGSAPRRSVRFWVVVGLIAVALVGLFTFSSSLSPGGFKVTAFDSRCSFESHYFSSHTSEFIAASEDVWTWERVVEMVASKKGFYVRDFPLQLGWNNVRFIIEAALLHASLLGRTLVIPSFVYARSCVFDLDVCSSFAQRFRRGDDIGMGDFQYLSEEEQIAWKIPISMMLDLPRLRQQHSVITVEEYLLLHRLDPAIELGNGTWDEVGYHGGPLAPTLRSLPQPEWDDGFVRVDKVPNVKPAAQDDKVAQVLRARGLSLSVNDAQNILREQGVRWWTDRDFERALNKHGYTLLRSFRGSYVEMFKAVTDWEDEVVDVTVMKGLVDQFGNDPADVVHVQGETHWNRKAGQLKFSTAEQRTHFASLVLHGIHPIPSIRALGDRMALRMADVNEGRQYLAAHMRRGDFAVFGWTEPTVEDHINRILNRLSVGMDRLTEYADQPPRIVDVPGITQDRFFVNHPRPRAMDRFFLATDVRNASEVAMLREKGAVMLDELLHPEDLRIAGWAMMFGDLRAQVEQEVATHAAFFYGHSMSSVAGGVANLRAARGQDPRTCYVD